MLAFDEQDHRYTWNNSVVPGVTTILKPLSNYDGIPQYIMDRAAERGQQVHLATELFDMGELDEDSISDEIGQYLDAWKLFRHTSGYEVTVIEARVFSEKKMYAGTLDRILAKNNKFYLADIKTTADHVETVGPQTAAYQAAWEEQMGVKISGRLSIRLTKQGAPKVVELKDRNDIHIFYNCLKIHQWRMDRYGK